MSTQRFTGSSALGVVLAVACVQLPVDHSGPARPVRISQASNSLREDEIRQANVMTAYEALERLRPAVLRRTRTLTPYEKRAVYLDGLPIGGVDDLRAIPAAHVFEIRYLTASEATGRYGNVSSEGIILITTKLGPR